MTIDQLNQLIVERASAMAEHRLHIDYILNLPTDKAINSNDIYDEVDGVVCYKEQYQETFDYYYDEYYNLLVNTYEIPTYDL